ncbi:50S ribosomal protein L11 methyltransferase [Veillonella caviae]|uniref:50S ribosomal protein L11 methyltransferase n=1 Tax=Veillonella caviae TaxID=248316 RepID=UPI002356FCF8|nr:50S ribosomal protein L11 methyltransferase [Veillonella caviae]
MQWIEISIVCERVATDKVTTLFSDYADNGIIEENLDQEPEKQKFVIYVDSSCDEETIKSDIRLRFKEAQINIDSIESHILDESTWYNSWQQYIEPTEILPNLIIKPAWQDYDNVDNKEIIEIDSDLSFGTGSHETTRSCARLLQEYVHRRGDAIQNDICLDIGTGTGILLLIAAKLGITNLIGIDIDENATNQARINASNNNVDATIIHGDLAHDFNGRAAIIIANLTVDPLKILLPIIGDKLEVDGALIISGIIDDRYDEIMPYITQHWQIKTELVEGSWHTFALQKL